MMYTLNELLMKMGAPETKEKGRMQWHYFDRMTNEIGGYAEVRLINGGDGLIAEMKRLRHGYESDAGERLGDYEESFYLYAERSGGRYKVMKVAFDGEEYAHPQKSIIELGLSIFHARALDISILMVEQAFNRQDIVRPVVDERPQFKGVPVRMKSAFRKEAWGIVVPFRPRAAAIEARPA